MNDSINSNNTENYGKFKVDNSSELPPGFVTGGDGKMGQSKYSGGTGESIYDDVTRDTEDDTKAEPGYEDMIDEDEHNEASGDGAGKGGKD